MTSILDSIDLSKKVESKKEYKKKLKMLQLKLLRLQHQLHEEKIPFIIVFEGWDAAGKGGAIKRVTQRLDPRGFEVHATRAPNFYEKRGHYLYRFWMRIPYYGKVCIFDRSWYGRVLVERVEGFAEESEWMRAYDEINHLEKMLTNDRYMILKLWYHISKDEQLARFKAREQDPFKHWKLTDEDWRNREKWDNYKVAVEDMLTKTSTEFAPWKVIEGEDKKFSRIKTLETIIDHIEQQLITKGIEPIK